jgi:hypothetical protein
MTFCAAGAGGGRLVVVAAGVGDVSTGASLVDGASAPGADVVPVGAIVVVVLAVVPVVAVVLVDVVGVVVGLDDGGGFPGGVSSAWATGEARVPMTPTIAISADHRSGSSVAARRWLRRRRTGRGARRSGVGAIGSMAMGGIGTHPRRIKCVLGTLALHGFAGEGAARSAATVR